MPQKHLLSTGEVRQLVVLAVYVLSLLLTGWGLRILGFIVQPQLPWQFPGRVAAQLRVGRPV